MLTLRHLVSRVLRALRLGTWLLRWLVTMLLVAMKKAMGGLGINRVVCVRLCLLIIEGKPRLSLVVSDRVGLVVLLMLILSMTNLLVRI